MKPESASEETMWQTVEHERDMLTIERVTSLVDGYAWMSEGRGPYRYDDGRFDDEVHHFVQSLLEVLPAGRWQNIQHFMNEYETTKSRLAASEVERVRLETALRDALELVTEARHDVEFAQSEGMADRSDWLARAEALTTKGDLQ